jgi:gluconate:H+ symporter, GntP family
LGLIAGTSSSPSSAFALLTPLLRPFGGDTAQSRERATIALALAISSSHGLMFLAPVPIAAAAILDAEWGRAGGLQRLCQETGMAEMVGERLAGWHGWLIGGVLVPFLVAAAMKTLQGSSLVAAITAAGIVHPILPQLGLIDANAKALAALAALAVGAGAMTASHVNDEYFWVVTQSAGPRPLHGFATVGLGTLLQEFIAAAALLIISLFVASST